MPTSAATSGTSSASKSTANATGNAVKSTTTTRISQMWFTSQTGPIASKSFSRCSRARGPEASAVQIPPPKSAPPKTAYMIRPRASTTAARFSSVSTAGLPAPRRAGARRPRRPQQQPEQPRRQRQVDEHEGEEDRAHAGLRRDALGDLEVPDDHPRLPPELGHHPARLERDEPERRCRDDRA